MNSRITTIARYTLLEAARTRLPLLVLAAILVLLGASFFIEAISVTEGARIQTAFYAAGARLAAVFIAGAFVLVSVTRELDDKGMDVLLALDLPRSHYILGKLAGFTAIAALIAVAAAAPLAWLAGLSALQWMLSLGLELAIVVALALFCVVTFSQLMPAASFVLAFYLFARALTAIRLIGAHPLIDAGTLSHEVIRFTVEGLALLMPALDAWTRTAWLVNEPTSWSTLIQLGGQSLLYVTLLAAAATFDFHRKNF